MNFPPQNKACYAMQKKRRKKPMNRRDFLKATAATAFMTGIRPAWTDDGKKLNIVFILIDDLGWRDLGCCQRWWRA